MRATLNSKPPKNHNKVLFRDLQGHAVDHLGRKKLEAQGKYSPIITVLIIQP